MKPDRITSDLAWRVQTQRRITTLLDSDPAAREELRFDQWRELKATRRELVRDALLVINRGNQTSADQFSPKLVSSSQHDGFRLENLVIESFPGWKVGLNLFLPAGAGPFIPVLCPCGHGPKWQEDHQIPPQVLARNGFAAALFDMPMFGEKVRGNDHFVQGAQLGMVGIWSNQLFLVDAVRTADYLETRTDITFTNGMGVTGVSGGGIATQYLAVIDDRVQAIAPVCSTAPFGGYVIDGLYTGCPESYLFGQAALGMNGDALLGLAAPCPSLVQSGRKDTLFTPELVATSVKKARTIYELENAIERFSWHEEDVPHTYTASMAERTAVWFRRWLGQESEKQDTQTREAKSHLQLPQSALDCETADSTINMADVAKHISEELESARLSGKERTDSSNEKIAKSIRIEIRDDMHIDSIVATSNKSKWGYPELSRQSVLTIDGIDLPVVSIVCPDAEDGSLVCFTEGNLIGALDQRNGMFNVKKNVISGSIRGYGQLNPRPTDYDVYGWCSVDRAISDLLGLCGSTAIGEQTCDALAIIESTAINNPHETISVYAEGEAAIPGLFAGLMHPRVRGIALHNMLIDFARLATEPSPAFKRYSYIPDILMQFDLPELICDRTDKNFLIFDPVDGAKHAVPRAKVSQIYPEEIPHVSVHLSHPPQASGSVGGDAVGAIVKEWLATIGE